MGKWLLASLLWFSASIWAAEELNYPNLLLLQTEPEQLDNPQWLEAWLSATDPALLRKMKRHGRDQWTQQQLKQLSADLKKQRKRILRHGLVLEREQHLQDYDAEAGGTRVGSTFHRYLLTFQGRAGDNAFFKRGISVLLLNPWDELQVLPFRDRAAWQEWYQIREIEQGRRHAKTLHVRYRLSPGKMVQNGVLEMALSGYVVQVRDYTKRKQVAEKNWKPDFDRMRKRNPLASGFANHLVPIHSLMIDGMSLGEVMIRFPEGQCEEKAPIGGKRLFICHMQHKTHVSNEAEFIYLDGQMIRMRHFRPVDPEHGLPKGIVRWAQRRLGYSASTWAAREWKKGRARLRTVDFPERKASRWMVFEATHGKARAWLQGDYKALP